MKYRSLYLSLIPVAIALILAPPAVAPISADSTLYLMHASRMAAGDGFSFFRSGFTVPFAFFIWLTGDPLLGGITWVRVIFMATIAAFWFIGRRFGGYGGAFLFSALVLLSGVTHYASTRVLLDGLYPLASILAMYLIWDAFEKMSLKHALIASSMMLYAILVKVSSIACILIVPAYLTLSPSLWQQKRAWGIAAITCLLPVVLYLIWSALTPKQDMADFFYGTIIEFFFRTDIAQIAKDSIPVLKKYHDEYFLPCLGPAWFSGIALALTAWLSRHDSKARFILCAFISQIPTFFIFGLVTMRPTQNMVVVFVMLICFGYLLLQAYKTLPNNKYRKISITALSLAVIAFLMAAPGIQYKVEKQVGSNTIVGRFIRGKKIDIGNIVKLNDQGSSRLLAYFEEQKADLVLHDFQFRSLNNISAIPHYAPKGVTLSPFYRQEKIDLTKRENLSFFEKNPEADIILHNWHDQVDKMDLLTNHTKAPEMNLFIISFKALCRQAEDSNKHVLLLLGNRWPNVRNILTTELHLRPAKETEEYVIYDFETLRNAGVCESGGKLYLGQEIKKLAQQNPNLPIAELFMPLLKAHAANADVFTSSQDNFPGVVFFH